MPSQGEFSNIAPASGSINVLFKNINNQQHVKAITVSNIDINGDNIALSLDEISRITLPLSASGNVPLDVNSITQKTGYYFLDVNDSVVTTVSGSTNASIALSPFLTEPFFYNNYNAIISNAEDPEVSFLKYDVDRSSGQVRPNNFNAIAGIEEIVFTTNYIATDGTIATASLETNFDTGSNNIVNPLTSSTQEFFNNRDVEIKALVPDIENGVGVPQTNVTTFPFNNDQVFIDSDFKGTTTLDLEIDSNANFNTNLVGAGGDRRRVTLATQINVRGELNFTYTPQSIALASGSFSSGNVFLRVIQQTQINSFDSTSLTSRPTLRTIPMLSSGTVDFLKVGLFFDDQQPYAAKAPVQDSSYTDTGLTNARYNGSKTDSADYGGIDPAISATSFQAKEYRPNEDTNFICSQSLSDRGVLEDYLFFGSTGLPTLSSTNIGAISNVNIFQSSIGTGVNMLTNATDTSTIISGLPNDLASIAVGEFLQFTSASASEIVQVSNILNLTHQTLTNFIPMDKREIQVVRGALGTTPVVSGFDEDTTITRFSGTRIFQLEGNRILAANDKLLWVKDNRTVLRTDETGYVVSTLTCTSGSFN